MNRAPPATGNATFHFRPYGLSKFRPWLTSINNQKLFSDGAGRLWQRRRPRQQIAASAQLSSSLFLNPGLDSQTLDSHDVSELRWIGPVPGDIAEVEAYCRIFRAAESLHSTLMDTLCDPVTGECMVSYESSSLEDKIVSVLGCMVSLLNKGRHDVLSGRSTIMTSGRSSSLNTLEDNLPPLAIFRSEIKRCCESLHVEKHEQELTSRFEAQQLEIEELKRKQDEELDTIKKSQKDQLEALEKRQHEMDALLGYILRKQGSEPSNK